MRYIDAPVLRDRDSNDNGTLDETVYYTTDANMNVTALVDADGDVVERYVYDPYGQVTFLDANWSKTVGPDGQSGTADDGTESDVDNGILFAGYRFDPETGLYHVRHRMYHPTLARWLQRDPAGYVDGMGLYEYARGAPATWCDPAGLSTAGDHVALSGEWRFEVELCAGPDMVGQGVNQTGYFSLDAESQKCCSKVDIVQIAKTKAERRWWFDEKSGWHIDSRGSRHPKYPKAKPNRWEDEGGATHIDVFTLDSPGENPSLWKKNEFLAQDFETCAVCTSGDEEGQIIACIKWGHKWTFDLRGMPRLYTVELYAAQERRRLQVALSGEGRYLRDESLWPHPADVDGPIIRWEGEPRVPPGKDRITLQSHPGNEPSRTFLSLLSPYDYYTV